MTHLLALRSNLSEIWSAQGDQRRLVTSFSGKSIYSSRSFMGRIFRLLMPKQIKEKKLHAAVEKTMREFWRYVEVLERSADQYLDFQRKKLIGIEFDPRGLESAENHLLKAALYFGPLWKDAEKGRPNELIKFLSSRDSEEEEALKELSGIIQFVKRKKDYEWATGIETPLDQFRKIFMAAKLKNKDEKKIQAWIDEVKDSPNLKRKGLKEKRIEKITSCRSVHKFLVALSRYFFMEDESTLFFRIGRLEHKLLKKGFTVLEEDDPLHLEWRERIKEGTTIGEDEEKIELGEELSPAEYEFDDQVRVFGVRGDHLKEVAVYRNESEGFRFNYHIRRKHFGIPLPLIFNHQKNGLMILRERLYQPISELEWDDLKYTDNDYRAMEPIVQLIKTFKDISYTPAPVEAPFDAGYFQFNADGEMRSAYPMTPTRWNYEALENFVHQCSQGIVHLFSYIMSKSGLSQLKEWKAYQRVAQAALKGEDVEKVAANKGKIATEEIIENRRALYFRIVQAKEKVFRSLSQTHLVKKSIKKDVNQAILEMYNELSLGFHVPDNFEISVINRLIFSKNLKPKPNKKHSSKN